MFSLSATIVVQRKIWSPQWRNPAPKEIFRHSMPGSGRMGKKVRWFVRWPLTNLTTASARNFGNYMRSSGRRPITGPLQNEFMETAQRHWRTAGQRTDLFQQIDNMLERIRRERGSGHDFLDFKTGAGGIIEAEFLVHALQMKEESGSQIGMTPWNC